MNQAQMSSAGYLSVNSIVRDANAISANSLPQHPQFSADRTHVPANTVPTTSSADDFGLEGFNPIVTIQDTFSGIQFNKLDSVSSTTMPPDSTGFDLQNMDFLSANVGNMRYTNQYSTKSSNTTYSSHSYNSTNCNGMKFAGNSFGNLHATASSFKPMQGYSNSSPPIYQNPSSSPNQDSRPAVNQSLSSPVTSLDIPARQGTRAQPRYTPSGDENFGVLQAEITLLRAQVLYVENEKAQLKAANDSLLAQNYALNARGHQVSNFCKKLQQKCSVLQQNCSAAEKEAKFWRQNAQQATILSKAVLTKNEVLMQQLTPPSPGNRLPQSVQKQHLQQTAPGASSLPRQQPAPAVVPRCRERAPAWMTSGAPIGQRSAIYSNGEKMKGAPAARVAAPAAKPTGTKRKASSTPISSTAGPAAKKQRREEWKVKQKKQKEDLEKAVLMEGVGWVSGKGLVLQPKASVVQQEEEEEEEEVAAAAAAAAAIDDDFAAWFEAEMEEKEVGLPENNPYLVDEEAEEQYEELVVVDEEGNTLGRQWRAERNSLHCCLLPRVL